MAARSSARASVQTVPATESSSIRCGPRRRRAGRYAKLVRALGAGGMTAPAEAKGRPVRLRSGLLEATFLPDLGMLGTSLRHRGDEVLALPGGLEGYRAGDVTGLPLLAPWANRLGARRYEVEGVVVDLEGFPTRRAGPSTAR